MPSAADVKKELNKSSNTKLAKRLSSFFKTGKGEYGEGDVFVGVKVPKQRQVAKRFKGLPSKEIEKLIQSKIHECRLTGLFILVSQYQHGDEKKKEEIFTTYIKNRNKVNNWDLVDSSAPYIVGDYLTNRSKQLLYKLSKSRNVWDRRIAIMSTFAFIKHDDFSDALKIANLLINDQHDLIHKASGWMLREVGNKDRDTEEKFLKKHYKKMPRTMLRYAIEKFPIVKRKAYLKK